MGCMVVSCLCVCCVLRVEAQLPQIFAELAPPPTASALAAATAGGPTPPASRSVGSSTRSGAAHLGTREQQQEARCQRMECLLGIQYSCVVGLCCALGLGGFVVFGEQAVEAESALKQFPLDDTLINAARLAMVLVAAVSYPVIHFTARAMLHDLTLPAHAAALLAAGGESPPMSELKRYVLTLLFFGGNLALALLTSELGELFTVFGSFCGWATMFGVPAALLLDTRGPYRQHRWARMAGWAGGLGGGVVCAACLVLEFTEWA